MADSLTRNAPDKGALGRPTARARRPGRSTAADEPKGSRDIASRTSPARDSK